MVVEKRKDADPIVLLGVMVLILMVFVSLSFRKSNFIAGSFRIDEVQICDELDETLRPVSVEKNMPPDSQQVCVWFSFSRARRGDSIEIAWYRDDSVIQKEILRLSEPRGVKAFYLLREDGTSLESGLYSVRISCNGREKVTESFIIAASSEDLLLENDIDDAFEDDVILD
ncbi:MAG: hypothetical protein FWE55_01985 [Synergistaceae bacterium]|nr:hypothetical protein [Synergistaceae bacterium]